MIVEFEQWKKILSAVNEKKDLNNIIEEIKKELQAYCGEYGYKDDEYKGWEESRFNVNYLRIVNNHGIGEHFNGTLLHLASRDGYEKVVRALIEAGADVNARTKNAIVKVEVEDEWTPLHFAALFDHTDVVKILLKKERILM